MISIFVLAMLAAGFAISMKTETKLARNANSEVELQWLGRSGVEYCRWILAQQLAIRQEPYDALNQVWAGGAGGLGTSNSPLANVQSDVKLGNGHFTWKIVDLERKMNINLAPEPMLQQALIRMGTDASSVTPIVSSIQDWIDPDDTTHMEGAESSDYESLDPPYEAKNGPLDDISELLLIKGVTPDLYWGPNSTNHSQGYYENKLGSFGTPSMQGPLLQVGLVDLFTSLSTGKINVNTASSAVLQMIPGVEAQVADSIISARDGEDDGTGLTGPYRSVDQVRRVPGVSLELARQISQFCDVRSKTFEVTITAESGGYTRHFTAVLGRANAKDVQVLTFYWK
jgi:general secretion pathway protein K